MQKALEGGSREIVGLEASHVLLVKWLPPAKPKVGGKKNLGTSNASTSDLHISNHPLHPFYLSHPEKGRLVRMKHPPPLLSRRCSYIFKTPP